MKTPVFFIPISLALFLAGPVLAQHQHAKSPSAASAPQDPESKMGKPTLTRSLEGMNIRLWVIPQEEHRKMMAGHMDGMSQGHMMGGTDETMMKEMTAGTHHIAVEIINASDGKARENISVALRTIAADSTITDVKLKSMNGHWGGTVTFGEKQSYAIVVELSSPGETWHVEFPYKTR